MSKGGGEGKVGSGKEKRQWDRRCLGQGKERIFLSFLLIGMQEFRGEEMQRKRAGKYLSRSGGG